MNTVESIGEGVESAASNHILIILALGAGSFVLFFTPTGAIIRKLFSDVLDPIGTIEGAWSNVKNGVPQGWENLFKGLGQGKIQTKSLLEVMPGYQIIKSIL